MKYYSYKYDNCDDNFHKNKYYKNGIYFIKRFLYKTLQILIITFIYKCEINKLCSTELCYNKLI